MRNRRRPLLADLHHAVHHEIGGELDAATFGTLQHEGKYVAVERITRTVLRLARVDVAERLDHQLCIALVRLHAVGQHRVGNHRAAAPGLYLKRPVPSCLQIAPLVAGVRLLLLPGALRRVVRKRRCGTLVWPDIDLLAVPAEISRGAPTADRILERRYTAGALVKRDRRSCAAPALQRHPHVLTLRHAGGVAHHHVDCILVGPDRNLQLAPRSRSRTAPGEDRPDGAAHDAPVKRRHVCHAAHVVGDAHRKNVRRAGMFDLERVAEPVKGIVAERAWIVFPSRLPFAGLVLTFGGVVVLVDALRPAKAVGALRRLDDFAFPSLAEVMRSARRLGAVDCVN